MTSIPQPDWWFLHMTIAAIGALSGVPILLRENIEASLRIELVPLDLMSELELELDVPRAGVSQPPGLLGGWN
jgi:hypothetical protein